MRGWAVRLVMGVLLASVGVVGSARAQRMLPRPAQKVTPYSDVVTTSLPAIAAPLPEERSMSMEVVRGPYRSVQVNVDAWGLNIVGDASNEPSITVDPNDPRKMAIGWRQFNSTFSSSLREAGVGYTRDAGHHWTFPGCLSPGKFGSDPVLDTDADGVFYYLSTDLGFEEPREWRLYRSLDGGVTWLDPIHHPSVRDKPWIAIDRTDGTGRGNLYLMSRSDSFVRSINGGLTFEEFPINESTFQGIGGMAIDSDGILYLVGADLRVFRSETARDAAQDVSFELDVQPQRYDPLGPYRFIVHGLNPGGISAQPWIAVDTSFAPTSGNVYLLGLAERENIETYEILKYAMFLRSIDRGETWSDPVRINDDPPAENIFVWFPMMSVAPNGRIDVVWNDTRNSPIDPVFGPNMSELYYSYSTDAGETWSANEPVSPPFDHTIDIPAVGKLGDYYTMVSDNLGVNVAYAATFNGEQDIWYLRLGSFDCNGNDIPDEDDIANGTSMNCNNNDIPDECEHAPDANGDGRVNLADYATFQTCFTGSGTTTLGGWPMSFGHGRADDRYPRRIRSSPPPPPKEVGHPTCCTRLDTEPDADIDLEDYTIFDEAFMK